MSRFNSNIIAAHAMLIILCGILAAAFARIDAGYMPHLCIAITAIGFYEIVRISRSAA